MGARFSKMKKTGDVQAEIVNEVQEQPPQRQQIDRSNFIQRNKADEVIVRGPGMINGNQFVAAQMERCNVTVHDFCDSITVDKATDCVFELAAVRGSVFIRDCTNSTFKVVCGQFRCRGCQGCTFLLHVKTEPVIESSRGIKIGSARVGYPELLTHMERALLFPTLNHWDRIHDFTPGPDNFSLWKDDNQDIPEGGLVLPFLSIKDSSKPTVRVAMPSSNLSKLVELTANNAINLYDTESQGENIIAIIEGTKEELSTKCSTLAFVSME